MKSEFSQVSVLQSDVVREISDEKVKAEVEKNAKRLPTVPFVSTRNDVSASQSSQASQFKARLARSGTLLISVRSRETLFFSWFALRFRMVVFQSHQIVDPVLVREIDRKRVEEERNK